MVYMCVQKLSGSKQGNCAGNGECGVRNVDFPFVPFVVFENLTMTFICMNSLMRLSVPHSKYSAKNSVNGQKEVQRIECL